ncbi:MAG: N-acetylmuramoyl-L-alanine amidase [Rikenellaceae bacterium]
MSTKFIHLLTILSLLIPIKGSYVVAQDLKSSSRWVIVIDPGHGGKSPGAIYGGVQEKDVNLSVGLLLEKMLQSQLPSAQIIFTRKTDVDIPLAQRSLMANNAHADIFISLHCNANNSTSAAGTETYVMGVDKSGANLQVAMKENSVIELEDDFQDNYGGYDPNSAESFIIFSLMQYNYQEQSLELASGIQKRLTSNTSMKNRGVKQAGFLVLWRTAMPSVLCEMGFLSNAQDRAFISSVKGQESLARSLSEAIVSFLKENRQRNNEAYTPQEPKTETPVVETPAPTASRTTTNNAPSSVHYRVQLASTNKAKEINYANFKNLAPDIIEQKVGSLYKYSVGNEKSYKEALTLQRKLKNDFNDCFVVAFDGDQQITLQQAKELLGK